MAGLYLTDDLGKTCNASCGFSCTSSGLPRPCILSSHTGLSICILLLTLVELCFGRYVGRESIVVVAINWVSFQLSISAVDLFCERVSTSRLWVEWKKQSSLITRGSYLHNKSCYLVKDLDFLNRSSASRPTVFEGIWFHHRIVRGDKLICDIEVLAWRECLLRRYRPCQWDTRLRLIHQPSAWTLPSLLSNSTYIIFFPTQHCSRRQEAC